MKSSVGLTTSSAVASARSSAIVFGASSPSTMWSAVMIANAMRDGDAVRGGRGDGGRQDVERAARSSEASAGSPIQPSPMLAIVMPSCVAAM